MDDDNEAPKVSEGARLVLSVLDEAKAELEREKPGWRIWFVPRAIGGTRWCAQPLPLLAEDSPDHLWQAMNEADKARDSNAEVRMFPMPYQGEGSESGA